MLFSLPTLYAVQRQDSVVCGTLSTLDTSINDTQFSMCHSINQVISCYCDSSDMFFRTSVAVSCILSDNACMLPELHNESPTIA